MTRDDMVRLARKSGIELYGLGRDRENFLCILESFTKLVVATEREACAEICDSEATIEGIAQKCAAAIRARSQT